MLRRDFIAGATALAAAHLSNKADALTVAQSAPARCDYQLPPGFYNFTGSSLANWTLALTAQQRGSSNAIIGCLGDSTVAGQGAASDELASKAKSLSWPTQLAHLVPNGSWSSVWGDNNIMASAGNLHDFDARLNPSSWVVDSTIGAGTLCGGFFQGHPHSSYSFPDQSNRHDRGLVCPVARARIFHDRC